ncbi:MAG: chemotaxis protein CheX [Acidobacteriaceae bacterium]
MGSAVKQVDAASVYGRSMDEAVDEVFNLMMGIHCASVEDYPIDEAETISAVIGLAGPLSGTCVLRSGESAAMRRAGALTGIEVESLDDMVKDATGEICNMVAGAWKGKLTDLVSSCMLSTPTVVTGSNYQLHTQRPEFRIERYYRFEALTFSFTLVCEPMQ